MLVTVAYLLAFLTAAQAACDNACSGHGTCQLNGVCKCYDNWGMGLSRDSGDCSDRICPFEIAWSDKPNVNGERHRYAECAGRGVCNRETGDCECFPGYEGKGCQRAVCPNDCSGHGQCTYIEDLPYQVTSFDWYNNYYGEDSRAADYLSQAPHTFNYIGWDVKKTRGCVCDPEWADVDCSKRLCPYGNDIMDHRNDMNNAQEFQTQKIVFDVLGGVASQNGNTFALTFKSKLNETFTTIPIVFQAATDSTDANFRDMERDIKTALESLPNRVIDAVSVGCGYDSGNTVAYANVTFTGDHVQGKQNLLTLRAYKCDDGCTPKLSGLELVAGTHTIKEITTADYNSYECGRRGKCNYDSGVCECFAGYTGLACNTITALV